MLEIVNATVIGALCNDKPYAFFSLDGKQLTIVKWFACDADAVKWFRKGWPISWEAGAEMRCYSGLAQ